MCLLSRAWASTSFVSYNPHLARQYCGSPPANAVVQKHDHSRRLSRSSSIVEQCPIRRKWATRTAATAAAATAIAAARLGEKNGAAATTVPTLTAGTDTELPPRAGETPSTVVILTSVLGDLSARQLRLIVDSPACREIEPQLRRCQAGGDDDAGKHTDMQLRELLEAVLEVVGGSDERSCAVKVVAGCPSLLLWEAHELRARAQELQDAASVSYHYVLHTITRNTLVEVYIIYS